MERVYPKLKEFCRERGYEFQVVDMRWGIRNDATNDLLTTEIIIRHRQTALLQHLQAV